MISKQLFLIFLFALAVVAFPTTPGTCNQSIMVNTGHGAPLTTCSNCFTLSAKKKSSGVYQVTLTGLFPIKGLLLYATDSSGKLLGSFGKKKGFSGPKASGCGGSNSAIGHTNASIKKLPLTFLWKGSTKGPVTFQGIAVKDFSDWYPISSSMSAGANFTG